MPQSQYAPYLLVCVPAGIILTISGLYKIISHYLVMRKNHILTSAKIMSFEKEVRYWRYYRRVYYYPILQFEYDGHTYSVRDPNGLSEDAKYSFEKYVGDSVGIRFPENGPYSAMLDYEQSLYRKYKTGAVYTAVGLLCLITSVMLIIA